jgi:hypothetical protein
MHTPFFPGTKEEGWWLFLADVSSNSLLAAQKVPQNASCLRRLHAWRDAEAPPGCAR